MIDRGFNEAVMTMARRVMPCGFDVADDAPNTYEDLRRHVDQTGRICVWNGASENTIFDDAYVNYAMRAWHDWTHYRYEHDFSLAGEISTALQMMRDLKTVYGDTSKIDWWVLLVWEEVALQATYYNKTGEFVDDQVQFAHDILKEIAPLAYARNVEGRNA